MIRFAKDWANYPAARYHTQTRNRSALEFAAKLKYQGIKNWGFFLALHNPDLANVDPHSPDLTLEQMNLIFLEIKENPWYYFREVALVPSNAGQAIHLVNFNRSNICLWWCFFNHITLILTQPRQTGKSFCVDLLMTGLQNFWCANTQINLITKDDRLRTENINRLKKIYDQLPDYLNFKTREDSNNSTDLSVHRWGNTYRAMVSRDQEKAAYNLGRGITTAILQTDEGPFQHLPWFTFPTALGSMGAAIKQARAAGEPYGIVHTTTAGRRDEKSGKFFYGMIQDSAIWDESYYDCEDEAQLQEVITRNSLASHTKARPNSEEHFDGNFQVYACFSYKQLGLTDEWMAGELKRTMQTGDDANRDYFNIWTSGTTSSPLPTELLERLNNSVVDPDHTERTEVGQYMLRWYLPKDDIASFMANREVIIGVDPSEAAGGDYCGVVFTDASTGGVVAAAAINDTNLVRFGSWLAHLLVKYPKTTLIMEKRSSGAALHDMLLEALPLQGIDPFRRIFNWIANDPHEHSMLLEEAMSPMVRRSAEVYARAKRLFGFATSAGGETSRDTLFSTTLHNAVSRTAERIHDRTLAQQIAGLTRRNGRVDHAPNEHDDLVIAYLMTHWFLTLAKNLSWYGIDSTKVMVPAQQARRVVSDKPIDMVRDQIQEELRAQIADLLQKIASERDYFLIQRYEQEVRFADSRRVARDGEEDFSIDAVLNKMREDRSTFKREQHQQVRSQAYNPYGSEHQGYAPSINPHFLPEGTVLMR
jgi:hypothetical protein